MLVFHLFPHRAAYCACDKMETIGKNVQLRAVYRARVEWLAKIPDIFNET